MLLEKIVNVKSLLLTQKRPQFVDWHRLSRHEKGRLLSLGPICYVTVSHPFVIIKAASVLGIAVVTGHKLENLMSTSKHASPLSEVRPLTCIDNAFILVRRRGAYQLRDSLALLYPCRGKAPASPAYRLLRACVRET